MSIPRGFNLPDSTRVVFTERRPINPPIGQDAMVAISNFEWSLVPPPGALSWTPTFAATNYYNNIYLPMTQVYSVG